ASLAALPVVFTLAACQGETQQQETAQPAEEQEVAQATYTLEVSNPMPHAMVIAIDYGTGEAVELGIVEPMGTQTFTVTAPPSTTATLTAQDESQTHTVSGEVTLTSEMAASWTIQ
ncbi:MAG: hypothetical protein ACREKI_09050, partial [Gemmatimonadota bacterium]